MKKILVFFGGESVEHDVSIITGVLTLNAIDKEKYIPVPLYVDSSGVFYTGDILCNLDEYKELNYKKLKQVTFIPSSNCLFEIKGKKIIKLHTVSCAINCMHGERGEDGTISSLLKLTGIPLASPNALSSAVSMDKSFTKIALSGIGVKTLPYVTVYSELNLPVSEIEKFGYPVIVKPNSLGSSIGITKVNNKKELSLAVLSALRFGESAIIEPCLENFKEINCAGYKDKDGAVCVSECESPQGETETLTFLDKYSVGKREFPAKIKKEYSNEIKEITKKVYTAFKFNGIIRIDYMLKDGEIYLNEINSVPGSLAYYLFCNTLKEFSLILSNLIELAITTGAKESTFVKKYKSGILTGFGAKGSKVKS